MAIELGTNWEVKVDGVVVARGRNATLQLSQAFADITNKDSNNWEESLPSIRSARIQHQGPLDHGEASHIALEDLFFNQASATFVFDANTTKTYSATGYIENYNVQSPHDDANSVDVTIRLTGAITRA